MDAVSIATYLISRGPLVPLNSGFPEEAWMGKDISLLHLKVFDCISYVHVDANQKNKLDAKSKKCTFIGYGFDKFGYRFGTMKTEVIRNRDVIFNEKAMYKNKEKKH